MRWIAATIRTFTDSAYAETAVDILADLFYRLGVKGVVIHEAVADPGGRMPVSVTGYLPENESIVENRSRLEAAANVLSVPGISACAVTYTAVDEEDWADSWKAHFYPQRIGRRIVVKPTWREYPSGREDVVVEIDPGMAFGTGTHATTRMCLIMLERHLQAGMRFLDVGTGSGILLAAAFRLGADLVWGLDNDPVAVEIAGANLDLNRVPRDRRRVISADLLTGVDQRFDLVCANILAETVIDLIPAVGRVLGPGGLFVCSGIITARRPAVEETLRCHDFKLIDAMAEEEWACLAAVAGEGAVY